MKIIELICELIVIVPGVIIAGMWIIESAKEVFSGEHEYED